MDVLTNAEVYQLISFSLLYPTDIKEEEMEELLFHCELIQDEKLKTNLLSFFNSSTSQTLEDRTDHYIEIFDFGKTSNLYITYLKLGEQKERGLELLKLKKYYEAAGFDLTDDELPDYLPLVLEFCANVKEEIRINLLEKYEAAIWDMRDKLMNYQSHYTDLFNGLIRLMELEGIKHDQDLTSRRNETLSLEDVRIMTSMRDQLIRNQLG